MPQPREVARLVFAKEFNASDLTFKESEDQYAPAYLLTPTGAKCNRVFVVGTLTEKDTVGKNQDMWRFRVVDPTGVFVCKAGQFNAEAAQEIADIEPPVFVSIVGKTEVFKPKPEEGEEQRTFVSIKPELVHVVDIEARNIWIQSTIKATLERLSKLTSTDEPDYKKAREYYGVLPTDYKEMLHNAYKALKE